MMIEKVTDLFSNQKKAEEMGRQGIKFVDSAFSADSVSVKWEELIKKLKEQSTQNGKSGLLSKLKKMS